MQEMFSNVVQIDDLIHAKQYQWEVAKTSMMTVLIWLSKITVVSKPLSKLWKLMHRRVKRRTNRLSNSIAIGIKCNMPDSVLKGCV